jgi:predicted amino acid dehydrogenase
MPAATTFAFLVHPRVRISEDLARMWRPLGLLPDGLYAGALRRLPLPPVPMATVEIGGAAVGHVLLVPYAARHMLDFPGEARRRVVAAVDRAVRLGADVVGLGALTAPVTAGGAALRSRTDIGVTNGNAFTAAIVDTQVRAALQDLDPAAGRHVAVVGATGSVGSTVASLLARDRAVDRLTLVARSRPRLQMISDRVSGLTRTTTATEMSAVADADVVVLLTASADSLLTGRHLKADALVVDATQPRNTSPDLLTERPDVTVIDGGIVDIPSLRLHGGDIGLPEGRAYACFAETALLALSGHRGHFAIGAPSVEQVEQVRDLAAAMADLGFAPTAPTSFGAPLGPGTLLRPGRAATGSAEAAA